MGALNKWECSHPGCTSTAVGVGGALGLRAIGWYFVAGPIIRCPSHRPDPSSVRREDCDCSRPCGACRAEQEADRFQADIADALIIGDRADYRTRANLWIERARNTLNT